MTLSDATKRIEAAGCQLMFCERYDRGRWAWWARVVAPLEGADIETAVELYRPTRRECLSAAVKIAEELQEGGEYGICHDCGCLEGEYHEPECDMEVCPFCFGQLASCDCRYERFGYVRQAFRNGLPEEKERVFNEDVEREGRLRYVQWPVLCAYCGQRDPGFNVPDEDWQRYVPRSHWLADLCRGCYDHLAAAVKIAEELQEGGE